MFVRYALPVVGSLIALVGDTVVRVLLVEVKAAR